MRLDGIPFVASPNFSSRRGVEPECIVIHYDAAPAADWAIRWLTNPQANASAHFEVGRAGSIWQMVGLNDKAWHAGVAEHWRPSKREVEGDVNRWSVGIELANHGYLTKGRDGFFYWTAGNHLKRYTQETHPVEATLAFDSGHSITTWWEDYPEAQLEALEELILAIRDEYQTDLPLVGHEEIGMPLGRKTDPGPLFPWDRFGRIGERRTNSILR